MKLTQTNLIILSIILGVFLVGGAYQLKTMNDDGEFATNENNNFTSLDPAEFAERISEGVKVIDIRTTEEIREGKVSRNALELDYYDDDFAEQLALLDKDQPYVIYCRSGNRSGETLSLMRSLGFEKFMTFEAARTRGREMGGI